MSRRREINNNAQRRFRQRQRDRLQTLEDKLADVSRRFEGMKLQNAHLETHLQRLGETQVGVAAYMQMLQTGVGTGSMQGWLGADGGRRAAADPFSHPQTPAFRDPTWVSGGAISQLLTLM